MGMNISLPNITAYNETCASIGLVMWAYRMLTIKPQAMYYDVLEKTMLNINLAAVSLDGRKFFYENMFRRAKELKYELVWPLTRSGIHNKLLLSPEFNKSDCSKSRVCV
jgi:uncharacterized protein